jgi:N-acetylglucosamine-6-phosphate deacetylase
MNEFIEIGEGHITNMTVAPELKGMHEVALLAFNHDIVLQAGHTNAEYKHIVEGIQVGIQHSTHFFNAMTRLHHRNPGTVGAILLQPEISCMFNGDAP